MPEDTQVFTTTLWSSDPKGTKVGIVVPEDVVAALGRGRRPPVVVTVDGDYSFRGTVAVMSGRFLISFNAETRAATGRAAGDEVEVSLTVDHAPRTVEPPAVLGDAMAGRPGTLDRWNRLAPSTQKAHALSIDSAKTDETRSRRVAKVLGALTEGLAEG